MGKDKEGAVQKYRSRYTEVIGCLAKHLVTRVEQNCSTQYPDRISEYDLERIVIPGRYIPVRTPEMEKVVIGIDWGKQVSWLVALYSNKWMDGYTVYYVEPIVAPKKGVLSDVLHPHPQRVAEIVEDLQPDLIIDDVGGLSDNLRKPMKALLGRKFKVYGCQFDPGVSNRKYIELPPAFTVKGDRVVVNKSKAFAELNDDICNRTIGVKAGDSNDQDISRQFMAHHLNVEMDYPLNPKSNRVTPKVEKIGRRDDHFLDAHLVARAGLFALNTI